MKQRSIVIIGGGIAGLSLARYLVRDGHSVTVVERAKDFSAQGHAIGFRGVGFEVMEELGLRSAAEKTGRSFNRTCSYTMSGWPLRVTENRDHAKAVGGVSITQRGLLHAVLHRDLPPGIQLRFGVKPNSIRDEGEKVEIVLSDGTTLNADIVVGADGANSSVRKMIAPEIEPIDFHGIYAGMMIKTQHGLPLDEMQVFYGKARLISFYPVDTNTVAVVLYQDDGYGPTPTTNSTEAWASYLNKSFARSAKPIRRILAGMKPGDEIFQDRIRQIPPVRAASGRIALVGDAGYGPTFFAGNGAALACVGAYCLAKCLRANDDDRAALIDYEKRILPFAAGYQANARQLRDVLFSRSSLRIALRRLSLKFMPRSLFTRMARRHYRGEVRLANSV